MNSKKLNKVDKPEHISTICEVDIAPLLVLIDKLPTHYWDQQNLLKRNEYPVFHSTEHIVMRFVGANDDPRDFTTNLSWGLFSATLLPIMAKVSNCLKITAPNYPKVMFARLRANSNIEQHIDHGSSHPRVHKIHVPLVSHQNIEFLISDSKFYLEPGKAYEVNNLKPHGVVNPTPIDRIHLIFEVFDTPSI